MRNITAILLEMRETQSIITNKFVSYSQQMEVWFGMEDGLNVGYWFRLLTLSVVDNENLYYYAVFLPSYIFPKTFW